MSKKYFNEVDPRVNFPKMEENVLSFWEKENIFQKSLEKNKNSKKTFTFYEGPPTANGNPGIHHVEARSFKDIVPRYKTMRGFDVPRQAGWDCHGLPVEIKVEKELGISGKPQIEEYGIKEFNALCRKSVLQYVDEWTKLTKRMAYWVDTDKPYWTMDNSYIEKEWRLLAEMWEKDFLYEDYKVLPYCPRCGTSLSSHELALGYKEMTEDPSVFIKFELKKEKGTYFLAWTTTPWTLPGNVALAVDEKQIYIKVETEKGKLILAEKRFKDLKIEGKVLEKFKGKELLNIEYEPLFNYMSYDTRSHFVVAADFVSMDEGTGIVHTAVMYGEDDFKLGKKYDLPMKHSVNEKGEFVGDVTAWAGKFVKNKTLEKEIIETLDKNGNLFKAETLKHTYPFCWRCGTPLLYYAMISWYLKTTAVKDKLIENNNSVNWIPEHIKEGRMGDWLNNNHDWALSRSRYWGTPLPIWKCDNCEHTLLVGSVKELEELSGKDLKNLDLHRPFIDEIKFKCSKCDNGHMVRVNFVLDCWFDSGAMPYASGATHFPADYISEAIDQTRGWFYTLLAEATLLGRENAYKNVVCLGHLLDEKGNKMSKSKGNVIDPFEVINNVGADATRWYMYSTIAPGPSFRFSENLVRDVIKRFMLVFWNSYNYFVTYSNLNNWEPGKEKKSENILDRWMEVRLQELVNKITNSLDNFDMFTATHEIEDFVVKDFSQWYIRRSRGRTDDGFFATSYKVLVTVAKLMAPFAPFVSDEIYKNLTKEISVHLADWPESKELDKNSQKLLNEMDEVRKASEKTHSMRKESLISLRQPLNLLTVDYKFSDELKNVLMDEVNVKNIVFGKEFKLDTNITAELKAEGEMRDVVRKIQEERKNLKTNLDEFVDVTLPDWPKEFEEEIKKRALVKNISKGEFKVERIK
ncbi:MAG TPA: isoleucine--tRNA ligase [Patescibacteria group bacterium]|nr:isoleucine--tRNA ligase [Patescibacteria group bacterium]